MSTFIVKIRTFAISHGELDGGGKNWVENLGVEFGACDFLKILPRILPVLFPGVVFEYFSSGRKMCVFSKMLPGAGPSPARRGGATGCGQAGAGRPGGLVPAPQPPCPPGGGRPGGWGAGGSSPRGAGWGVSERGFHRKRKPRAPHHRGGAGGQPSGARPPRHRSLALACWGLGRRSCSTMSWRGLGLCWLPGLWAAGRA